MAQNVPPADINRSAQEALSVRAYDKQQEFIKAQNTKSADELKLENEGKSLLGIIPNVLGIITHGLSAIESDVKKLSIADITAPFIEAATTNVQQWKDLLKGPAHMINVIDKTAGKEFINWFLDESLGVQLTADGVDAKSATDTITDLSGFLIELPILASGMSFGAKLLLGERAGDAIGEYLTKFTEELGLNWMVGSLLEQLFEQAVGRELEELVNVQKLPSRLDMQTTRQLLRQHKLDKPTFHKVLRLLGYPPDLQDLLLELDTAQLPVTDIQAARQLGYKDDSWFHQYLQHMGYSDEDIEVLEYVYLNHLNTQAHSQLAATARRLFVEGAIDESQFRTILGTANTPQASIDIEVQNINLEKTYGRVNLSKADIKKLFDDGIYFDKDVIRELKADGYSENAAEAIYSEWNDPHAKKSKHIPLAKILQYANSGILSPGEASDKIQLLGYDKTDADFMITHPTTRVGNHPYELKPSTVIQAYVDGVIGYDEAANKLSQLNVDATEATYMLSVAADKIANKKHKKQTPKSIEKSDIKEAFDLGIITESTAETMLEDIGFDTVSAHFIAWNWYIKKVPDALTGNFQWPGLPGTIIPPPPQTTGGGTPGVFSPSLVLVNNIYYRVYDTANNPTEPPNSKLFADSSGHEWYILNTDTVPPGWVYVSGSTPTSTLPPPVIPPGIPEPPNPTG